MTTFPAPPAAIPRGPGWAAPKHALAAARARRTHRRLMRLLLDGDWKQALVDACKTQHAWKAQKVDAPDGTERVAKLMFGVNLLDTAYRMHKIVATATPFAMTVLAGSDIADDGRQTRALEELREDGALNIVIGEAVHAANVEQDCVLRAVSTPEGPRIEIAPADRYLPLGDPMPNRQPSVWEGRWIVETPIPGRKDKVRRALRVERQRRINGQWAIESEAYDAGEAAPGAWYDTLTDLASLPRIALARALEPEEVEPQEVVFTGLPGPTLCRVFTTSYRGDVRAMMSAGDFGLIDAAVAATTRVARTMQIHGSPRARVPSHMVDKATNRVDLESEAFEDPDKQFEYVIASFNFDGQLQVMDNMLNWLMVRTWMAPGLLGLKLRGGAAPESVEKLELEATQTLAVAREAALYMNAGLSMLLTVCSALDAGTRLDSGGGYPVARVRVELRPQIPKDEKQIRAELAEQRTNGQISLQSMLEQIYGVEGAQREMERMATEADAEAARQQRSLGLAMGIPGGGGA